MMSAPTRSGTISRDINLEDLHPRLRLRLKPQGPTRGQVDGGWWPRSRDLAAELPSLLAVLAVRLGRIERLTYHLTDWSPAPRKIICRGGVVQLGALHAARLHRERARRQSAGHPARGATADTATERARGADGSRTSRQHR